MGNVRLRAGDLRHSITFKESTETQVSAGTRTRTWNPIARCPHTRARINTVNSTESAGPGGEATVLTHVVTVRYRDDITSETRIYWNARVLRILGPPVDTDGAHVELVMQCAEVVEVDG